MWRWEADIAVSQFLFSKERCEVVLCNEANYLPQYMFSKYPEKKDPTWNLIYLFPFNVWLIIFISIIGVALFFHISSKVYIKWGMKDILASESIDLYPFRYKF